MSEYCTTFKKLFTRPQEYGKIREKHRSTIRFDSYYFASPPKSPRKFTP